MKLQFQSDNFTVFESALYRTCSAVISVEKCLWVVDPNWLPGEIQIIRDFVDQQKNNKNIFLLCTHSDYDHIIGCGAFPEAEIVAGLEFVTHPQPQKVVQQILDFDDMYYITRNYPVTYPEVNHIINNFGQRQIQLPGSPVFFDAKGHIRDGLITVFPDLGICIAGDYLSNIEIPMVEYSFENYLSTLQSFEKIVNDFSIRFLMTGHGDLASSEKEIRFRIKTDIEYIEAMINGLHENASVFDSVIRAKGNERQNRLIHQNNVRFRKKNDLYSEKI